MWHVVPNKKTRLHYMERNGSVFFYGFFKGLVWCPKD